MQMMLQMIVREKVSSRKSLSYEANPLPFVIGSKLTTKYIVFGLLPGMVGLFQFSFQPGVFGA